MDVITKKATSQEIGSVRRNGVVCPSLVLAARVVCDKCGIPYDPSISQIREYCTTELYTRCSRRLVSTTTPPTEFQDLPR